MNCFTWLPSGKKQTELVTISGCATSILCSFLQSFPSFFCIQAFLESSPLRPFLSGFQWWWSSDSNTLVLNRAAPVCLCHSKRLILLRLALPAYVFSYGMAVTLQWDQNTALQLLLERKWTLSQLKPGHSDVTKNLGIQKFPKYQIQDLGVCVWIRIKEQLCSRKREWISKPSITENFLSFSFGSWGELQSSAGQQYIPPGHREAADALQRLLEKWKLHCNDQPITYLVINA